MKKYLGALCSFVVAVLTFVFLSCSALIQTLGSITSKSSGWDLLTTDGNVEGLALYKVSAIALIFLAALLLVMSILIVLKNAKVLKTKLNLNLLNDVLLTAFVVFAALGLIAAFILAGKSYVDATAGVGTWLNLAFAVLACALAWLFARKDAKGKK